MSKPLCVDLTAGLFETILARVTGPFLNLPSPPMFPHKVRESRFSDSNKPDANNQPQAGYYDIRALLDNKIL